MVNCHIITKTPSHQLFNPSLTGSTGYNLMQLKPCFSHGHTRIKGDKTFIFFVFIPTFLFNIFSRRHRETRLKTQPGNLLLFDFLCGSVPLCHCEKDSPFIRFLSFQKNDSVFDFLSVLCARESFLTLAQSESLNL